MSRQYKEAKRRAKRKIGFYKHLKVYVVVNVFMAALMVMDGDISDWFPTPLFWGMGLLFHYIKVFGLPGAGGLYTEDWERRIFEEELDQIKKEEEDMEELELRQMKKEKPNTWDDSELV